MQAATASQPQPLGNFGQGLSGFLLAVIVHKSTWALSAAALWLVNPLIGIVGGFAVAAGACAVAYDAVRLRAVRTGMRIYFWVVAAAIALALVAAILVV